jgi:hydrogenase/urease accessory protein HupE
MSRLRLLAGAAALLTALLARQAQAHDEMVSSSEVEITGREVRWHLDVGLIGLARAVPLPPDVDERGLQAAAPQIGRALARGLEVEAGGRPLPVELGPLRPAYEPLVAGGKPVLARVIQTLTYRSATPFSTVRVRLHVFSDLTSQHRALVLVRWGAEARRYVRLGPAELTLTAGALAPSAAALAWEFLQWGTHHIFVGYDHIAFLLALVIAVTRFRELLAIVTSFTIAHSLTLLLAALDLLHIPARLSEALIAASIVYVAAENLLSAGRPLRRRWLVTFGFGLVHGLGFATELRARLAELPGQVVFPVLSFNLGVEVGQVAIVAAVYPLLVRLREAPTPELARARQRRLLRMGSVPILLLGLFWLVDRLTG